MRYIANDPFVDRFAQRFDLQFNKDWTIRTCRLFILNKFLEGKIYDHLQPWHLEYQGGAYSGSYVPLARRRPCVIYRMAKIIVDESVSMLFGQDHFPIVRCEDDTKQDLTSDFLQYVTRVSHLRSTMLQVAKTGSVGSVCVIIKILKGNFYFDVIPTLFLNPIFDPLCPDHLINLKEKRTINGETLISLGYKIDKEDKKERFYLIREWTEEAELYYLPYKCSEDNEDYRPIIDSERSTFHGLDFVPAVWIKNMPSCHIDGDSTFEPIIDMSIEIDYQLSQLGRLLKYSADPTLVIKGPEELEGSELIKGIGCLRVGEEGDAYFVEMSKGPTDAVIAYARQLREFGLEVVRGNRMNPDKIHTSASGKALQMMNSPLISLVEEMRLSYGDYGLLKIYQMILDIYHSGRFEINYSGTVPEIKRDLHDYLSLDWPDWYPQSGQDKFQEAQTLQILTGGEKVLSQKTAMESVSSEYNILDIDEEIKDIANKEEELYNVQNGIINDSKKETNLRGGSSQTESGGS